MKTPFFVLNKSTRRSWPVSAEEAYLYSSKKFGLADKYIIVDFITKRQVHIEDVITCIRMHEMQTVKAGRIIPPGLARAYKRMGKEIPK